MNTMEINKIVAGVCGSLLLFLGINAVTEGLYHTHSEEPGYEVELAEAGGGGEEAEAAEIDVAALIAAGDAAKGEKVFKKCSACHKIEAGANAVGPTLHAVVDRPVASAAGFGYSEAMQGHGGNWDVEHLFAFLGNPKEVVSGTAMAFAGLKKETDRADLIAYLQTLAD